MHSSQARRVIAAGMIGNVLEWYDFAIYGYFATAIGRQFFPHEDAVAQLLSAFGVFALGYVMRPVGGVLIGHIGDRFVTVLWLRKTYRCPFVGRSSGPAALYARI